VELKRKPDIEVPAGLIEALTTFPTTRDAALASR
jgi:hypothetical protein